MAAREAEGREASPSAGVIDWSWKKHDDGHFFLEIEPEAGYQLSCTSRRSAISMIFNVAPGEFYTGKIRSRLDVLKRIAQTRALRTTIISSSLTAEPNRLMRYQSHSDSEKGMVDSAHRLTRLGIPANLGGSTVLDIGCNEGYYCDVAAKRGAAKVIGIDGDPKPLEFAREKYANPAIEFRHQHWSQLPEGFFDLVLWTSAMHYELDPLAILEQVRQRLKPNGMLILECGVVASHKKEMIPMQRHDGTCWYPSRRLIEEYLLSDFAYRQIGAPELIGTDPAPRYVYHCRRRIPTVLLFRGQTHTGKSSAAMALYESATKVIELDLFVHRIAVGKYHNTGLEKYIREKNTGYDLTYLYEGIDSEGLTEDWARLLAKTVAATDKIVVIEGYMTDRQRDALKNATKGRVKFWEADAG